MSIWPWSFWHRDPKPSDEASEALASSRASLIRARQMHSEATLVGQAARRSQEDNHFGASVAAAMGGDLR